MSLVALRSVINCFPNGKISDTIIFFSSSSCLILCLYSRCLLHITQFTCRLAAHLALSLIHSLSIHCTRHPSTLSLRIHIESAHGTMTVCSLARSPAFFWSFMRCHERIEKISHCSGPTHKYINTYEIFIFLRAADSNLHYERRAFSHFALAFTIHNSPSGYKKTAEAAVEKQNDNDDEKREKKWSQQGNVLRHFAFLKRIKNSISHKTIFGYSLCTSFACSRPHVCCISICGVCELSFSHIISLIFIWQPKKCFANMLSNVRALDIFDVFFLFFFFFIFLAL